MRRISGAGRKPRAAHGGRFTDRSEMTERGVGPATNGAASVSSDAMFRHPRADHFDRGRREPLGLRRKPRPTTSTHSTRLAASPAGHIRQVRESARRRRRRLRSSSDASSATVTSPPSSSPSKGTTSTQPPPPITTRRRSSPLPCSSQATIAAEVPRRSGHPPLRKVGEES